MSLCIVGYAGIDEETHRRPIQTLLVGGLGSSDPLQLRWTVCGEHH
jgi:hypothetical protein